MSFKALFWKSDFCPVKYSSIEWWFLWNSPLVQSFYIFYCDIFEKGLSFCISVMLIDLVKKFIFPCFIEFLLYFHHFFLVCYYILFNHRLLKHCLEKTLCFRQNIIFILTQNNKNIRNFYILLWHCHFFVCSVV